MSPSLLLILYCALILLASLVGGWIPIYVRLSHFRMQVATSFVAGLMLGVGLLSLLPHAWYELESPKTACGWLLVGFLVMFFILRFLHFHHHGAAEAEDGPHSSLSPHECREDGHHAGSTEVVLANRLSWGGAALGLTLHTVIAGMALAASIESSLRAGAEHWLGLGAFLVIILHKPFDSMTIGTLMAAAGWSKWSRHLVNGLFALAIPVGVGMFYLGAAQSTGAHWFLGVALAFSAGTFVCIAASDLLPELQFHSHDRLTLSVSLVLGLLLAVGIASIESEQHDHGAVHLEEIHDGPGDHTDH